MKEIVVYLHLITLEESIYYGIAVHLLKPRLSIEFARKYLRQLLLDHENAKVKAEGTLKTSSDQNSGDHYFKSVRN